MSIRELNEFIFLCKKAGFTTLSEVQTYMNKNAIDWKRLLAELDALCFPKMIKGGLYKI